MDGTWKWLLDYLGGRLRRLALKPLDCTLARTQLCSTVAYNESVIGGCQHGIALLEAEQEIEQESFSRIVADVQG